MGTLDWIVLVAMCMLSLGIGLYFVRKSSRHGAEGYFTGNRGLAWWAIGASNTATYSSGSAGFVMLVLVFGLAGNWLWWAAWIVWMPLVAIIWAKLWRRMQIVTTAELISLRYGGWPATLARRIYAFVCCFGFAVLIIGYITGFFAQTIAPLVSLSEWEILLIFGGTTVLYTMFGGLLGVVVNEVVHFGFMMIGGMAFFFIAVAQHGGWAHILERVNHIRPEGLTQLPPTAEIPLLTVLVLVLQGLFFAGSPTAGEGMTAQRFMGAKNEAHAIGGQLFNAFLSLSFRTIPLIGLGIIAISMFWAPELLTSIGPAPAGFHQLDDAVHCYAELIKATVLPVGFIGLLMTVEAVAYMNTLSSLVNWGSSFIVNDFYKSMAPKTTPRGEVTVSRITTLLLFVFAGAVAILYVKGMIHWFLFINSAMVIFLLPLSWLRFFWWRFNVWGELAATVLGLPASIYVWFVLDYQNRPLWEGVGLLFLASFVILLGVTLLTPAESDETLQKFYAKCRPPGLWAKFKRELGPDRPAERSLRRELFDCLIGTVACLGLVIATNAVFVLDWFRFICAVVVVVVFGAWLIKRVLMEQKPTVGSVGGNRAMGEISSTK
jgi:SSS family solute:Na+ symporter